MTSPQGLWGRSWAERGLVVLSSIAWDLDSLDLTPSPTYGQRGWAVSPKPHPLPNPRALVT